MILIAGAGAMADAAKAMRRIQRRMDRRADLSRRRANRRARHYDYEPERAEFPCALLCSTCGYYIDAPADDQAAGTCPSCSDADWLDLALEPTAARVRDMETADRMSAPSWIRWSVIAALAAVFVAVAGVIIWMGIEENGRFRADEYMGALIVTALAATVVVPLTLHFVPRLLSVALLRGRERIPNRWHIPLPLPQPDEAPTEQRERVTVSALDDTITAPISRRECLAYQLCVLFDTPGDARPPEWVLQEQRAVGVGFDGGLELASNQLYLESPVALVEAPDETSKKIAGEAGEEARERYEAIKTFLRQRGLFITDGDFHFYEAVLEPGDQVDMSNFDTDVRVLRHSDAAPRGEAPELPQP